MIRFRRAALCLLISAVSSAPAFAQGTIADYQRAMGLRDAWQGLAVGVPETPIWVGRTTHFWFRRSVKGGNEFALVNPDAKSVAPAFDHVRLAAGLSTAANA